MHIEFKNKKGFTLFELLIIISIMAIIIILAIPSFQHYRARQEFSTLYYLMRSQISLARSHAMISQSTVVLCASADLDQCQKQQWQQGLLLFVDNNNNRQHDSNEKIISSARTELKFGTFNWHGNASHPNEVVFQSDSGLPRGSMGHFSYCNMQDTQLQQDLPLGAMGHLRAIAAAQCP